MTTSKKKSIVKIDKIKTHTSRLSGMLDTMYSHRDVDHEILDKLTMEIIEINCVVELIKKQI